MVSVPALLIQSLCERRHRSSQNYSGRPTIAHMDLQPIAVVLQLVRPARSSWGPLGDDWLAWMNENGRRIHGPTA
jgi:hypothetical protein